MAMRQPVSLKLWITTRHTQRIRMTPMVLAPDPPSDMLMVGAAEPEEQSDDLTDTGITRLRQCRKPVSMWLAMRLACGFGHWKPVSNSF